MRGELSSVIYEIGEIMMSETLSVTERLQRTIPVIWNYSKAERCSIMLVDEASPLLRVVASTHKDIVGATLNLADLTVSTRTLLDDEPFFTDGKIRSIFQNGKAPKCLSDYSYSVPLKHMGVKLGVLNLAEFDGGCEPSTEQRLHAVALSRHLSLYLFASTMKDRLDKKVKCLEQTTIELKELNSLKSELTGFLVHDLKGPISTIMANLDMLSYEPLNDAQQECVTLSLCDTNRLLNMVAEILDTDKIEEGRVEAYKEEVDAVELINKEIFSLRNLLRQKKIEVIQGMPDQSYQFLDGNLIGRVVANLLRNAIQHSPDGSVIYVDAVVGEFEFKVKITDQGEGIPDSFKKIIFDKYYSSQSSTVKFSTGLGLTFCKLAVELHGGQILVEDAETHGSRFVFTIPRQPLNANNRGQ